jgi:hypothetical protein
VAGHKIQVVTGEARVVALLLTFHVGRGGQGRGMQPVVWSPGGAPEGCRRWCGPADGGVNFFIF